MHLWKASVNECPPPIYSIHLHHVSLRPRSGPQYNVTICSLKFIRIIHSLQEIIEIQLPDRKDPTLTFDILITNYLGLP